MHCEFQIQIWSHGFILAWNQLSPITEYLPWLSSEVQYLHWPLNLIIRTRGICATLCNCSDIQKCKALREGKTKISYGNTNHFSNCQLLSDVQAKSLDHFHTEALKLSVDFTPSWPFSEHHNFPPEVVLKICEVFR